MIDFLIGMFSALLSLSVAWQLQRLFWKHRIDEAISGWIDIDLRKRLGTGVLQPLPVYYGAVQALRVLRESVYGPDGCGEAPGIDEMYKGDFE